VDLEGSEAAGERCLELGGEEDPQLCDDASGDELVRGHVEGRVPHLDACSQRESETRLQNNSRSADDPEVTLQPNNHLD